MNMAINKKALFLQMSSIYKVKGGKALVLYLAKALNYLVINRHLRGSFSQKGEDLFIDTYFNHKKKGFYIDIGAFHPSRYNNTNFFYDRGWSGMNIEPTPSRIKLFINDRPRDINVNIGIGSKSGKFIFYEFDSEALSTFSKEETSSLMQVGYKLKKKTKIQMYRLEEVMRKYVKSDIDFMTVDTEGLDMEVLKSNNWKKYRPKLLCIETIDFIDQLTNHGNELDRKNLISVYLLSQGYEELYSNGLNTIYKDKRLRK